ncbi:hypothetical protein HID58_020857 [Brassica napus]|uniref:AAA+ ATPase domain-containing protein n=1 Tax=Brassica napus TaxID=3708 RepID=A0ABQ8CUW0_BRANA|nr:hypothetical protein HID58_020857 [Brassica napus]
MMKANLEALDTATRELRERRVDLSRRVSLEEDKGLERLAKVEGWLSRAESIDSEVSDLLREEPTETKRLCLFGYCSKNCISSCKYGKKVSKKLEEVKELLSKGVFEELAEKRPASKVVKKDIQTTIGLDSMVGKAWGSIMKPEGRTLGIYGMGGVGKTTLLARINNKFDEEVSEFDVVIWVVVSKDLQYKGIQDQILRRLRADQELEKETEEKKASFIENILRRKKFILLLDDLWSAVDLNKIGVPRPTQENGSKIVFTTRKKEVCRHMRADDELKIDCLSTNEAWELFQNVVGEAPLKKDSEILTLAKKISEKCHGLPLALNVIGKAMSCKEDVHEWRHANDVLKSSSREFPGMEENILSVLKFSYDGLEDDKMKSCFMYCSLFPEDYEIKKEELIEYWINEGFINGKRDEDGSNNKGHVIIGSLVRAHLLMESETTVKMHDVLREMALWIGSTSEKEEEKQCVKSGVKLRLIPDDINWSVSRRISLMSNQIEKISCCPKCPNLSTLFLRDNDLKGIPGKFFQFMPSLVVLDLSRNRSLRDLPEEICSLTSLQYLNLSYTRISSLSVGLKGLRKLISLDLEFTKLKSIDGIGTSLPNLQKFVLLLDDLWSAVDLNKIGVPRPTQENGSKIVFTTRKKEVCRHMRADDKLQIDCLPANEAWELFRSIVGEDTLKLHQDIPALAKQICEKCYGLPLALNVIGKAMSCKKDFMPALVVLDLSRNRTLRELPEEICSLISLQYLNLSRTCISSLPVCLKGLRKLISLDLEFSRLKSIDGIGTSLPNLQVLKLYFSSVFIDARSIEVLQLLEHLKILTGNVKDALMLESIQRVERLASCVQCLWISEMSAEVLTLNTVALDGLRKLDIESSKISEIKIDWKSKEKEDLLCNSSPYFKHLSRIAIFGLEGPKELSWLLFAPNLKHLEVSISGSIEELINKEKGMSFRNVHPEMTVPFPKLESLDLSYLPGLKRICSSPPALPHLKNIIVKDCPNLPKAAMKFPRHE